MQSGYLNEHPLINREDHGYETIEHLCGQCTCFVAAVVLAVFCLFVMFFYSNGMFLLCWNFDF